MAQDKVSTTCYLQVEPKWGFGFAGAPKPLQGARVVRVSQKKPDKPLSGTVTVKLALNLPAAVFLPLEPSAEVDFSLSEVVLNRGDVTAEGEDANDDD